MTNTFKIGDKVRAKIEAKSLAGASIGGKIGTVERCFLTHGEVDVAWDQGGGNGVRIENLEPLVSPNEDKIEAALKQTRADLGLCGDFDRAVEKARNMTFVERLDATAVAMNRGDVFRHFEDLLYAPAYKEGDRVHYARNEVEFVLALIDGVWRYEHNAVYPESVDTTQDDPFPHPTRKIINTVNLGPGTIIPEYVAPQVPEVGDYVRVTYVNGDTHESEVTGVVGPSEDLCRFHNINFKESRWAVIPVDQKAYNRYAPSEPHNVVTKIEPAKRPVKIPEIGKWIEATTADGKTHTFEVTENNHHGDETFLWDGWTSPLGNGRRPAIGSRTEQSNVVDWHYVDAPVEPVEIDGYWIVRTSEFAVKAYDTKENALNNTHGALTSAMDLEDAYSEAKDNAEDPEYHQYLAPSVAIIKFLEQENK